MKNAETLLWSDTLSLAELQQRIDDEYRKLNQLANHFDLPPCYIPIDKFWPKI